MNQKLDPTIRMPDTPTDSQARSNGVTYQHLLDTDSREVPEVLRLESPRFQGADDLDNSRYTSREWFDKEVEGLWKRVWQFACREEQIPHVGSYVVYDIAHMSFIVVRSAPNEIKAFYNACLHRGRQLKDVSGRCSEFRCPFHGFAWKLDGSLGQVPARWDFPQIDDSVWGLPEAKVGTWGGFVFINPDPNAGSLEDFLGDMPQHFDRWNLADRYIQGHVCKVVRANWKIVQEAFCESYHVGGTHPQALPYLGDVNSQIDVWDNFSRVITAGGTVSPLLSWEPTEEEILRYMLDIRVDEDSFVTLTSGQSARLASAAAARERWRPIVGDGVDEWSDAEFIDNIDYTLFPNFHPWGAYNRIVYRFRPNGDDHTTALHEIFLLAPFKGERPMAASTTFLGADDSYTEAPELGMLGKVFDQDGFNMPMVQKGLRQTAKPGSTLSLYQEAKVRWLHQLLGTWVEG
jgi:phenylpropionate dioxygenase-like ring-hydroxylating dioxygenase large terminal subunit